MSTYTLYKLNLIFLSRYLHCMLLINVNVYDVVVWPSGNASQLHEPDAILARTSAITIDVLGKVICNNAIAIKSTPCLMYNINYIVYSIYIGKIIIVSTK